MNSYSQRKARFQPKKVKGKNQDQFAKGSKQKRSKSKDNRSKSRQRKSKDKGGNGKHFQKAEMLQLVQMMKQLNKQQLQQQQKQKQMKQQFQNHIKASKSIAQTITIPLAMSVATDRTSSTFTVNRTGDGPLSQLESWMNQMDVVGLLPTIYPMPLSVADLQSNDGQLFNIMTYRVGNLPFTFSQGMQGRGGLSKVTAGQNVYLCTLNAFLISRTRIPTIFKNIPNNTIAYVPNPDFSITFMVKVLRVFYNVYVDTSGSGKNSVRLFDNYGQVDATNQNAVTGYFDHTLSISYAQAIQTWSQLTGTTYAVNMVYKGKAQQKVKSFNSNSLGMMMATNTIFSNFKDLPSVKTGFETNAEITNATLDYKSKVLTQISFLQSVQAMCMIEINLHGSDASWTPDVLSQCIWWLSYQTRGDDTSSTHLKRQIPPWLVARAVTRLFLEVDLGKTKVIPKKNDAGGKIVGTQVKAPDYDFKEMYKNAKTSYNIKNNAMKSSST